MTASSSIDARARERRGGQGSVDRFRTRRGILSLWVGFLAGPLLALASQLLLYAEVPVACNDAGRLPLHLTGLVTLLLTAGALWLAWSHWRRTGRDWPGAEGGVAGRSRFLAALGTGSSAFFALVVLAMWAPVFVFSACQGG